MPEVPAEIETEGGTLRELLVRLFTGTPVEKELIDRSTGEMKLEGLFEVALNNVPHNGLPQGLDTPLRDGDMLLLSLILLGGG